MKPENIGSLDPELAAAIREGNEYLVVGIVLPRAYVEKPGLWARLRGSTGLRDVGTGERWATLYRADSARQAEDLARANVRDKSNREFELFVAGVVDFDDAGRLRLADDYSTLVDPDAEITA